jgi:hypothetical protein
LVELVLGLGDRLELLRELLEAGEVAPLGGDCHAADACADEVASALARGEAGDWGDPADRPGDGGVGRVESGVRDGQDGLDVGPGAELAGAGAPANADRELLDADVDERLLLERPDDALHPRDRDDGAR